MTHAHPHPPEAGGAAPPAPQGAAGPRGRRRGLFAPLGALGLVAAAVGYVATVSPHESGHYPTCPFLMVTGLYCPGCGGLRMVNSLAHGDVAAGFGLNPLAFLCIPLAVYLWARWTALAARGRPMTSALYRPKVVYAFLGVLVAYWILRNLPFAEALAP